jgi:PHS family inorganic phosphate transporter-like MFS transporter
LTIPETPRYTIDIERDILQGEEDVEGFLNNEWPRGKDRNAVHPELDIIPKASRRDFFFHFRQWQYGKVLLGTAGSWFFIDIAFYGLGLNNSIILQTIGFTNPNAQEVYEILYNVAVRNVIIQCAGTMPGYFFSIAFIDMIGRKRLQLCSFGILTLIFAILGFAYGPLTSQKSNQAGFITMLVLCQFFMNFGANTTTVIPPGAIITHRVVYYPRRSFPHSISYNGPRHLRRLW